MSTYLKIWDIYKYLYFHKKINYFFKYNFIFYLYINYLEII